MAGNQGWCQIIRLWDQIQDGNSLHKPKTFVCCNRITRTTFIENYLRNNGKVDISEYQQVKRKSLFLFILHLLGSTHAFAENELAESSYAAC